MVITCNHIESLVHIDLHLTLASWAILVCRTAVAPWRNPYPSQQHQDREAELKVVSEQLEATLPRRKWTLVIFRAIRLKKIEEDWRRSDIVFSFFLSSYHCNILQLASHHRRRCRGHGWLRCFKLSFKMPDIWQRRCRNTSVHKDSVDVNWEYLGIPMEKQPLFGNIIYIRYTIYINIHNIYIYIYYQYI